MAAAGAALRHLDPTDPPDTVGSGDPGSASIAAGNGARGGRGAARADSPTATPAASTPTASTAASPPPSPIPAATRGASRIEQLENEVAVLVNQERAGAGCGAVRTDERLRTAARGHSTDMATHDYFSHTGRDGSSPWDRAKRAGYAQPIGENIAYGYRTAADVMRGWMNSSGHRENILNCAARAVGVGLAYSGDGTPYWTQLFGAS